MGKYEDLVFKNIELVNAIDKCKAKRRRDDITDARRSGLSFRINKLQEELMLVNFQLRMIAVEQGRYMYPNEWRYHERSGVYNRYTKIDGRLCNIGLPFRSESGCAPWDAFAMYPNAHDDKHEFDCHTIQRTVQWKGEAY